MAAAAKPAKDKKKKKKGKKGRKPRERGGDDDAAGHALTPEELANWRVQDEALFARRLDQEVAIMRRLLRGKLDPAQLDAYIAAYRARAREELMHKFACRRCLGLRGNVRQLEREIARWKASDAALRAELDKGRQHYVRLAKDAATTEHENQALIKQQQQLSDHAETIKRLEEKIEVAADREARMRRLLLIKVRAGFVENVCLPKAGFVRANVDCWVAGTSALDLFILFSGGVGAGPIGWSATRGGGLGFVASTC